MMSCLNSEYKQFGNIDFHVPCICPHREQINSLLKSLRICRPFYFVAYFNIISKKLRLIKNLFEAVFYA